MNGEPDASYFRTMVQARHVFSFVVIGRLGWDGPWKELVSETVETLVRSAKRADGFYVHKLDAAAGQLDSRADLYDQAFILFALGAAGGALGREAWFDEADTLLDRIEAEWKHPRGGFREGEIADSRIRRQNPHMHLFEAFLALHEASGRPRFMEAALSIAQLAQAKFVDATSGALLEYFTDELEPVAGSEGRMAEPGHCFEWAWLFERLANQGWVEGRAISDRLTGFARRHGIDSSRAVAINEVLSDGAVHNAGARLWPQTERLKAAVARYRRLGSESEADEAVQAWRGLQQYLEVPIAGLWRDKLQADGTWIDEMAPGSSLYHISCAINELARAAD
jgi:mannose-6-phosphate isomerase